MIFKINYDGDYQDSFIIECDTIEEGREIVYKETAKRGWEDKYCWSEKIKE